jgi:poly(3-hydroxybutyrate) depolymerase
MLPLPSERIGERIGERMSSSCYPFTDPRDPSREITVHLHRPPGFTPDSPILMVMHGLRRNGADYRDFFVPEAERRGFLVVAPEFPEAHYPHPHAYNYAGMCDAAGAMLPREHWLFPVLDAVFEDVRSRVGSRRERFFLFGHSAGGQLVHRLATFGWLPSIERAIAANSGSYTLPVRGEAFPFGLDGVALDDAGLRAIFARPLTVQLGDADVDVNDEHLPREPASVRQGPHRFARGHHYLETARREAGRLGVSLAWRLAIAPGVAHSGEYMAPFAVRELGL